MYQVRYAFTCFIHMCYEHIVSLKHGSVLNTCSNDFIHKRVTTRKRKIALGLTVRDHGGVPGEERVVDVPKFHSWGKHIIPLTNINSD